MPSIGAAPQETARLPDYSAMELDPNQKELVEHLKLLDFDTLYVVGPGGYGKTEGIRHGIREYKNMYPDRCMIRITAMTGRAADVLGVIEGIQTTTFHSWLGLGTDSLLMHDEGYMTQVFKTRQPTSPLTTDVLIIDEASMFTIQQMEVLNNVLQSYRKNWNARFGGLKLILVGDPMQLSPVPPTRGPGSDREETLPADSCLRRYDDRTGTKYVILNHPHRCENLSFQHMLRNLVSTDRHLRGSGMSAFLQHYRPDIDTIATAVEWALENGAIIISHRKSIVRQINEYVRDILEGDLHEFSGPENLYTNATIQSIHVAPGRNLLEEVAKERHEIVHERMRYFTDGTIRAGQRVQIRANHVSANGVQVYCGDICTLKGRTSTGDAVMVRQKDDVEVIITKNESTSEHWQTLKWRGYPFIAANAATVHLVQGSTIHGKVLFWTDIRGDIYGELPFYLNVAASRVTEPPNFVISHIPDKGIHMLAGTAIQNTLDQIWSLRYMQHYPRV